MFNFPADSTNSQYLDQVSFYGQEQVEFEGGYDQLLVGASYPLHSLNRSNKNLSPPYDNHDIQFLSYHHHQQQRRQGGYGEPTIPHQAASCSLTSTSTPVVAIASADLPTRHLDHNIGGQKEIQATQPVGLPPTAPETAPASSVRKRLLRKDRHSKIVTAKGPRDRRMRLSLDVAKRFFHLQDELGFDKPSKTVDWLLTMSKDAIAATAGEYEDIYGRESHAAAEKSSASDSDIDSVTTDNDTNNSRQDKGKAIIGEKAEAVLQESLRAVNIANEITEGVFGVSSAPPDKETRKIGAPSFSTSVFSSRGQTKRSPPSDPTAARELREKARARARERTMEKKLRKQCMQLPAACQYNKIISCNGMDVHEINSTLEMASIQMQRSQYYSNTIPTTTTTTRPVAPQPASDGSVFLQCHFSSGLGEMISMYNGHPNVSANNSSQVLGTIFQDQSNFLLSPSLSTAAFGELTGITDHAHFLDNRWDGRNNP